ncbi:unnamed protein product [Rotaria magnacalcarata]
MLTYRIMVSIMKQMTIQGYSVYTIVDCDVFSIPPLLFFVLNKNDMNINRQAYDQTSVRIHQTRSNDFLYTSVYIVDVNNNDGARVQTMNDRSM